MRSAYRNPRIAQPQPNLPVSKAARSSTRAKINSAPKISGKALFKTHFQRLMDKSKELPAPPQSYSPEAQYRITISQAIAIAHSPGRWLRPSMDIIVSGAYASEIAQYITGAQQLPAAAAAPAPVATNERVEAMRNKAAELS